MRYVALMSNPFAFEYFGTAPRPVAVSEQQNIGAREGDVDERTEFVDFLSLPRRGRILLHGSSKEQE